MFTHSFQNIAHLFGPKIQWPNRKNQHLHIVCGKILYYFSYISEYISSLFVQKFCKLCSLRNTFFFCKRYCFISASNIFFYILLNHLDFVLHAFQSIIGIVLILILLNSSLYNSSFTSNCFDKCKVWLFSFIKTAYLYKNNTKNKYSVTNWNFEASIFPAVFGVQNQLFPEIIQQQSSVCSVEYWWARWLTQVSILTWYRGNRDHEGGSSRARLTIAPR